MYKTHEPRSREFLFLKLGMWFKKLNFHVSNLGSGLGWGIHVNPWLIHVNVWQKPLWYCKVISIQLIKINLKKLNFLFWKQNWDWLKKISNSNNQHSVFIFLIYERYNFMVCWLYKHNEKKEKTSLRRIIN